MCEICGQWPCVPRCPNWRPARVGRCSRCREPVYEGDAVYLFSDALVCDACLFAYERAHARVATRHGFVREVGR